MHDGHEGWDDYAPFYDWENAKTLGRRDVGFWQRTVAPVGGRVLELGCGTGRIAMPLARTGVNIVGIDRSAPMLARAAARLNRAQRSRRSRAPLLVRGDIRTLPFADASCGMVVAAYGILQSLVRDRDLVATFAAVHRVLARGGAFGIDLVPDVPNWREYTDRVQLRGRMRGRRVTLIESVRQDRAKHLTTFAQRFVVRGKGQSFDRRFTLTFRTLPMPMMVKRLERAGFTVESLFGDYKRAPWKPDSETWLILARKV